MSAVELHRKFTGILVRAAADKESCAARVREHKILQWLSSLRWMVARFCSLPKTESCAGRCPAGRAGAVAAAMPNNNFAGDFAPRLSRALPYLIFCHQHQHMHHALGWRRPWAPVVMFPGQEHHGGTAGKESLSPDRILLPGLLMSNKDVR